MEINNNNNINNLVIRRVDTEEKTKEARDAGMQNSPNFKGIKNTLLNQTGRLMNSIENGGFLVLFLIQDFCGMTVPRSIAGFLRDREETGKFNRQEGLEVLGREGLTGPCMMAVAPLSLLLAAKFGHSTSVNTELIRQYGNSLKDVLSKSDFDRSVLNNADKFKTDFYRANIENILKNTVGKENVKPESVEYILKQLHNMENIPADVKLAKFRGKAKYRDECIDNITKHINELKYSTGHDLEMLNKVKVGSEKLKDIKTFKTENAFDGLVKYANDAITANKKLDKLDVAFAESIKHNALGKRILTNVGMLAATLGVLSVLPRIYAFGKTAPGARKKEENINQENGQNVSFKGKNNFIEKLGKSVDKKRKDFITSELEYNGHNFTNTLMAGLSVFGLIIPRGLRAYNRAETDEKTGKKDLTELWEIILRDLTSSLSVVFAVPMLTRACVTSYEKNSGFVLMQKNREMSKSKTILDLLNPYSKSHVLSNSELSALYDNINSKEKMLNFCKYIDQNGGDLKKIIAKSEDLNAVFNDKTMNLSSLNNLSKEKSNAKIIEFVNNIETHAKKLTKGKSANKKQIDEMITKLMRGVSKGGNSKITSFARGLNSVPGLLSMFLISPYILGWCIPRLTYRNTRRIHEKEDREKEQQKLKIAV